MKTIFALIFALGTLAQAGPILQYEPAVMEISGTLGRGRAEHPNGSWFEFQLIKLDAPASIQGDTKNNELSEAETNIKEIQLSATEPAIQKKISTRMGKKAILKGTIFHSHTAWHVRKLVILVTDVK